MAGHSHWAGIKHKKKIVDAKRGKIFSKISRAIMSAARQGGGDPSTNIKLKYAIDDAKEANMPKEKIERAIKKGIGKEGAEELSEVIYEGYGPNGVAIMLEILTENKNRTASEIRKIFERKGGRLGESNCVRWLFKRKGLFIIGSDKIEEDELLEIVLDAGAEDMKEDDGVFEITCEPTDFENVNSCFNNKGIDFEVAKLSKIPSSFVNLDIQAGKKVLQLLDELEEHDDVQQVYSNFEIPKELLEEEEVERR